MNRPDLNPEGEPGKGVVRTRNLAVRVPEDLHDAAMERARAEGKTLTALVIGLLRLPPESLESPKPPWAPGHTITTERSRYRMALEAILSVPRYEHDAMVAIARQALR